MPVRLATAADLPAIGSLLVELCRDPVAHCIHSWSGEASVENAAALAQVYGEQELTYVVEESADGLVGAFGCELDHDLGRGWFHGPHARSDWDAVADSLHAALREALPPSITEFNAFLNVENARGGAFYERHGFTEQPMRHHEYLLSGDAASAPAVRPFLEALSRPSFFELFDALFPNAYYGHERLLEMQGKSLEIFVTLVGDQVVGFCVPYRAADARRGEIQFLGVHEDLRRTGLGGDLLAAGITWLRGVGASEILLNVADAGTGARRLYEQVGFELQHTGVGFKLVGRPDPESSDT